MKIKRVLTAILALAMTAAVMTGCQSNETTSSAGTDAGTSQSSTESKTELSGSVATNGSTSMEEVIGALSEQFMADNSGVKVSYDPTGSGTGIEAVKTGSCDIGLSSRALKEEETAAGLKGTTVALDGIAIIVNENSKIEDLTVDQIAKIFMGEVTACFASPIAWIMADLFLIPAYYAIVHHLKKWGTTVS